MQEENPQEKQSYFSIFFRRRRLLVQFHLIIIND